MTLLRWAVLALAALSLAALSLAALSLAAPGSPAAADLAPGAIVEGSLAVGEIRAWTLPAASSAASSGARQRVRVDQRGLDVELTLRGGDLDAPWKIDGPFDRDGVEILLLPETSKTISEPWTLELRALASAGGSFRLRVDEAALAQLPALEATTEAGRAWAEGTGDGRRRAVDAYQRAAEAWRALAQPFLAVQSLYAVGVLQRLLGESEAALATSHRVLPLWRGLGKPGREADTWNEIGLVEARTGNFAAARRAFEEALAIHERVGDRYRRAYGLANLCLTHLQQGALDEGIACYEAAWSRIEASGDVDAQASVLTTLGHAYKLSMRPDEALDAYRRALDRLDAPRFEKRRAETLNNLGVLHRSFGEHQAALGSYLDALRVFRRVGDRPWQAKTLHNLAVIYELLGDADRAAAFGRDALALRRELGDRAGEARELLRLGHLEIEAGRPAEGAALLRRALAIEKERGDQRREARALGLLAEAHAALGEPGAALEASVRALDLSADTGDRALSADLLVGRARAEIALGRPESARSGLATALDLYRSLRDPRAEAWALYWSARAARAAGDPETALVEVERALDRFESLAVELTDVDLRASFSGSHREVDELRIDLLADAAGPAADTEALDRVFEASERARARDLARLLRRADLEPDADPELARELRSARRRFRVTAERFRASARGSETISEAGVSEATVIERLAEVERLEAERRRRQPVSAALLQPTAVSGERVRSFLDPSTVLAAFALGDDRSFLFLLSADSIEIVEMPPRARLESWARRLHRAWSAPGAGPEPAETFAGLLPATLWDRIVSGRRLLLVPDGALWRVPFAALPIPGSDDERVLDRVEVVVLPSASILTLEREHETPVGRVAVLADPVFDARDLRLAEGARGSAPTPPPTNPPALPRLRMSRLEAEAIVALAPPGSALAALDFDADKALVTSGRLADFRFVHLATHGLVDDRHPALSGLMFSTFDRRGEPRDGFLALGDIYRLRLRADLVVLSACRTALGKEVDGAGLVGLTRGFLHAGARHVAASLWSVGDRSTAVLMAELYAGLLTDGLPSSSALRRAQSALRRDPRYADPHHWAGFGLIGGG